MEYIIQYIVTYWWLFGLMLVSAVLELYVVPLVIAWYKSQNPPKYRHFSVVAACIFCVAIIKFIVSIPAGDPSQAQELKGQNITDEISLDCGCTVVCTCAPVTPPSDTETVTQSYVDSLILASEVRELTLDEIKQLNQEDLALLRNAIFAMAGMQYNEGSKYWAIFQSYDWYKPYITGEFSWDYFNSYQFKNMGKIIEYEKSMGYRKR